MEKGSKIYVAGHRGMVGSAILRELQAQGYENFLLRTHAELDLTCQADVAAFFEREKPEYVFLAAARVGGIKANSEFIADFLYENLMIECNVIRSAYLNGVKKLCFLGSSCIYPRECPQPIKESSLLTGPLEPTNEGYAIAKIAGFKLCEYYSRQYGMRTISLMPCNLYGRNDDFDLNSCHVLSALVRRFSDAVDKGIGEISLWGTGKPKREFMNVEDTAAAAVFLMLNHEDAGFINVGTGEDISIADLAAKIATAAGFKGKISWDSSKPDGMMRKCMDVSRLKSLGFKPKVSLDQGIASLIAEYRSLKAAGRL